MPHSAGRCIEFPKKSSIFMPDIPVIDSQAIENLRSLNPGDNDEFLREIVQIFLADTPLRITELEQSLAASDVPKFARTAHSIKGSSSNLGAMALRAVAEKLEHQSRHEGLDGAPPLLAELKNQFARAQLELEKLLAAK
jgi:HPt (histidine-containing phosphotransfer) domain-containing protein